MALGFDDTKTFFSFDVPFEISLEFLDPEDLRVFDSIEDLALAKLFWFVFILYILLDNGEIKQADGRLLFLIDISCDINFF